MKIHYRGFIEYNEVGVMNMRMMDQNKLKRRTAIFFLVALFVSIIGFSFYNQFQGKEVKLNATYTAEATVRKVETQLSRYLENSDLLKSIISSGHSISQEEFAHLARFMKEDKNVIEAYELAPKGVVQQVYPYKGNEEAIGLNMLKLPERKTEALLAKNSNEYTIAGPYELKQGGIGALIFDPIYVESGKKKEFWGFSILVINWDKFLEELQIKKLGDADYKFDVWKKDAKGNRITIMNDGYGNVKNALTVSCSVPNDTWYFEIAPRNGWIPLSLKILEVFLSVMIAAFLAVGYWQTGMRKHREAAYAKKLEKSAKEAQVANEAKTRFLFNMSHDIRTPMNAIVGYSNLLEESLDNKEVALGYIKKIKASNKMLISLINYILEMARIESGKVVLKEEQGDLRNFIEILKAVSEPQVKEKDLDFTWDIDVEHVHIICDTTKLREIVMNIVNNAIKYTPQKGKVILSVKELEPEEEGYASYCFKVKDNGIGMHKDYIPHIFEEFSRERTSTESKVAGVGLGLPIVKSLVDMMDGTIKVESEQNKGTTFSVFLSFPIAEEREKVNDQQGESKRSKNPLGGKQLLLVEDNELNADIAEEILTRQGFLVDLAENGQRCLELLKKKSEKFYDAILMDIQMPVLDGYETTKAIRNSQEHYAQIPIIAMTANAFEEDREHAIKAGMNAHIAKPVDFEKLIRVLSDML